MTHRKYPTHKAQAPHSVWSDGGRWLHCTKGYRRVRPARAAGFGSIFALMSIVTHAGVQP